MYVSGSMDDHIYPWQDTGPVGIAIDGANGMVRRADAADKPVSIATY